METFSILQELLPLAEVRITSNRGYKNVDVALRWYFSFLFKLKRTEMEYGRKEGRR
jgi:hypothetical protein